MHQTRMPALLQPNDQEEEGRQIVNYTKLGDLRTGTRNRVSVFGLVTSSSHRFKSRGSDWTVAFTLLDDSLGDSCTNAEHAIPCVLFSPLVSGLPLPTMVGDLVIIHGAKVSDSYSESWLQPSGRTHHPTPATRCQYGFQPGVSPGDDQYSSLTGCFPGGGD